LALKFYYFVLVSCHRKEKHISDTVTADVILWSFS
jgi:hypothetical protein